MTGTICKFRAILALCGTMFLFTSAGFSSGIASPESDSTKEGGLSVSSVPADADVIVDGKMFGRTPVLIPNLAPGLRLLRVSRNGFCDFTDSVTVIGGTTIARTITLDSACGLVITSVPESAAVYVEHVFVGRSPVRLTNEKAGWKSIQVMRLNHAPWEERVLLVPGAVLTVDAKLKSKFGTLSFDVFADDIEVVLDGKAVSKGSLADYMIPGGWHDIGARKAAGAEEVTESVYFFPGESVRWQARFDVPSRRAFFWSIPVPGLGQVISGSLGKGLLFMGGFVAACAFTYAQHLHFQSNVEDYNAAVARYHSTKDESLAKTYGDGLAAQYDRVKSVHKLIPIGIAAAAAIYAGSLVDAFLNHATVNTISQPTADVAPFSGPDLAVSTSGHWLTIRVVF